MLKQFLLISISLSIIAIAQSQLTFLPGNLPSPTPTPTPSLSKTPRVFINLDYPIETQYEHLVPKKSEIKEYLNKIISKVSQIPNFIEYLEDNFNTLLQNQNEEWIKRIKAVSSTLDIDLKSIAIMNIAYEVFCTSAIIADKNNSFFIARNFDGNNDLTNLTNLTNLSYEAYMYKNNQLMFIGQGIFGYVGFLNGVKIGKFSISANKRDQKNNPIEELKSFVNGYRDPLFLINQAFEYDNDYEQVVERLTHTEIAAGIYYIVEGDDKGEVITRSKDGIARIDKVGKRNNVSDKWYIVQTNADKDEKCKRRKFVEDSLETYKHSEVEIDRYFVLEKVMSVEPVKMSNTVFSTVQSANKDESGQYLKSLYWSR